MRVPLVASLAAASFVVVVSGVNRADAPATSQPDGAAAAVGPVSYFVANCARCHGEIGSPYVGLAKPKRGDALNDVLREMAEGPAQAPLDDKGLADQRAMHDAIYDELPYAWVLGDAGEALPGTTLTRVDRGRPTPIAVDAEHRFTPPPGPATLRAERNGKTVEIKIP